MTDPSKCIALNDCEGDEPPVLRDHGCAEKNHSQACSHEMQPARSAVCMFAQIKWIELSEVAIGLTFVHLRLLLANNRRHCYWRLSRTLATQTGMTNDWLAKQGLLSIRDLWIKVQGYAKKSASLSSSEVVNRPVRSRTPGGVGGGIRKDSPYPD
jgi:hypothetical protein